MRTLFTHAIRFCCSGRRAFVCFCLAAVSVAAQTALVDFNAPWEYNANFNVWNDQGGTRGTTPSFVQTATSGVNGSGGISVFGSTDTTVVYAARGWDFSTNGAALTVSVMVHADGQVSADKVQLGIINTNLNGLNSNPGVAFESFRFIPAASNNWTLREQVRSTNVSTETLLGTAPVVPGHWYKFLVSLTNIPTGFQAWCDLLDFGTNGLTPGPSVISFSTLQTHTSGDITVSPIFPALRAFQDGGIDAWDNFLIDTASSTPVFTLAPMNVTALAGETPTFTVLADGPGPISYHWYTNGVVVPGVSGPQYTTPPLTGAYTNLFVVALNQNGGTTNPPGTGQLTVLTPEHPTVAVEPASGIDATDATINGAVTSTGGFATTVTVFYGPIDGGHNPAGWLASIPLGGQSGPFSLLLQGLTTNTSYYYNVEAVNLAGAAWAPISAQFTTLATNPVTGGVAVLTQHNDLYRTGANLAETQLNVTNVNTKQFGLLYTLPVDDQVYAQPLVMTNVAVLGHGHRNLLLVATVNDSVYAFDSDSPIATDPLWHTSFLSPGVVPPRNIDMTGACGGGYRDFSGNMGIVGAPVIDPATETLYVVARTKENGGKFVQRLHALDLSTGLDRTNSPVVITATYPGTGDGSVKGVLTFDPQRQNQRAALALVKGVVYIAWSSHCDWSPYHGYVIGYNATTLQQTAVFNATPNGYQAGIWMSNQGIAADEDGNLYLSTGNGAVGDGGDPHNPINRGESFLKLTPQGSGFQLASWFTPFNWPQLEGGDLDLGSGGVLLIPGTKLLFSGGKQGVVYLVNRDNMGGLSDSGGDVNVVQSFQVTGDQVHGGPVWWSGPTAGYAYIWPSSEYLQQYQYNPTNGQFNLPAVATSVAVAPNGQPGGLLSLSANGTNAGSAVLWASHQASGDANQSVRPGILRALDATDVSHELWNSSQNSNRDGVGQFAKFCAPTVANGKVYLATFSNRINVYGLLPPPALSVVPGSGKSLTLAWPQTASGYTLQSSTNLRNQVWSAVTNTVTPTNGLLQVTVPETVGSLFYRLKL